MVRMSSRITLKGSVATSPGIPSFSLNTLMTAGCPVTLTRCNSDVPCTSTLSCARRSVSRTLL